MPEFQGKPQPAQIQVSRFSRNPVQTLTTIVRCLADHVETELLAKRTTDLRELCDIWKTASEICDSILKALKSLKDSRSECGTPQLYDLALDYKNAAFKRYQLNQEALQWEKTEIPEGLFPKST